ncbi:DUF1569 domain-containing protein [Novipirellula aureliae]|nr:DUF1569 domain-containing protein [Novipirellula aureliae]
MADSVERRELTFSNVDEIVADARRLAAGEVRACGSHSFGQILHHLALSHDVATGQLIAPSPPLFMRLLMPLMKRMVINAKPLKPGIKLPAKGEAFFWPNKEFEVSEAIKYLEESVENYKTNGPLEIHPFFGKLNQAEADQLVCRHAALHLSFVHPVVIS